jgi:hypothetical protein
MSTTDESSCCPTPVADLRLPTQSANIGPQNPSEKRLFTAIEKRYGKPDPSPDSDRDTGFRRGVPGVSNQ